MYCLHWMFPVLLIPKSTCALAVSDDQLVSDHVPVLLPEEIAMFDVHHSLCILCLIPVFQ